MISEINQSNAARKLNSVINATNLTNSVITRSNVTNSTVINSNVTDSVLTNCTIINSTVTDTVLDGCSIIGTTYPFRIGVNITSNVTNGTTTLQVFRTYRLTIGNNGTVPSTYNLSFVNLDNASSVTLNVTNITLAANSIGHALLSVTDDDTTGNYRVMVTALFNETLNATTDINTTVEPAPLPPGNGGGGGGCSNTCNAIGFLGCSGYAQVFCADYDNNGCLENQTLLCPYGQWCQSGLGCVPRPCFEEWFCDDWGGCDGGHQSRKCIEGNACGTEDEKPALVQGCETPSIVPPVPIVAPQVSCVRTSASLILLALVLIIIVFSFHRKSRTAWLGSGTLFTAMLLAWLLLHPENCTHLFATIALYLTGATLGVLAALFIVSFFLARRFSVDGFIEQLKRAEVLLHTGSVTEADVLFTRLRHRFSRMKLDPHEHRAVYAKYYALLRDFAEHYARSARKVRDTDSARKFDKLAAQYDKLVKRYSP